MSRKRNSKERRKGDAYVEFQKRRESFELGEKLFDVNELAKRIVHVGVVWADPREPTTTKIRMLLEHGRFEFSLFDVIDNLGGAINFHANSEKRWLNIPTAEQLLAALEQSRRVAFETLHQLLLSPDQFLDHFRSKHRIGSDERQLATLRIPAGMVAALNTFAVYIVTRHNVKLQLTPGWRTGRVLEAKFMLDTLLPFSHWSAEARTIFDRIYIPVEEVGGFALPGSEADSGKKGASGSDIRKPQPEVLEIPERVLFSMGTKSYRELRALVHKNRNQYVAIIFSHQPQSTKARVAIDSPLYRNALYLLCGELKECLETAQRDKSDIRASGVYVDSISHDVHGSWKRKLLEWLGE